MPVGPDTNRQGAARADRSVVQWPGGWVPEGGWEKDGGWEDDYDEHPDLGVDDSEDTGPTIWGDVGLPRDYPDYQSEGTWDYNESYPDPPQRES